MQAHRRLTLAIVIATFILGINAFAVVNGWSPFEVPNATVFSTTHMDPAPILTRSIGESLN